MFCGLGVEVPGDQHGGDDPHSLLRVRPAMPQTIKRRRYQLPFAKEFVYSARRASPEYPGNCDCDGYTQDHPEDRRDEDERNSLYPPLRFQHPCNPAARRYRCAAVTADERMRRTRRKPEVPGDHVPDDCADQPAE